MARKKITPEDWLSSQDEMLSWTTCYVDRWYNQQGLFRNARSSRSDVIVAIHYIISIDPEFFARIRNAWSGVKYKKKHGNKTLNITLSPNSYAILKGISKKKTIKDTVDQLIRNADKVDYGLEMKYAERLKKLEESRKIKVHVTKLDPDEVKSIKQQFMLIISETLKENAMNKAEKITDLTEEARYALFDKLHTEKARFINSQLTKKIARIDLNQGRKAKTEP